MDVFFKNIRLIDPVTNRDEKINIIISDGYISYISVSVPDIVDDTHIIDGSGLIMSPGFIDIHVHLREPGQEYKETIASGTDSAANGGFTGVLCMPNTKPTIDNINVVSYIKTKSKDLLVDVLISGAITIDRKGDTLTNMKELTDAGVVLFTDDGTAVSKSDIMKSAFENAIDNDLLLSQHCEDHSLTNNFSMNESQLSVDLGLKGYPRVAEEITLFRDIKLAEYCGNRRYHAQHLSTSGAVELVRNAKMKKMRITCEVTPHHFVLTEENLKSYNSNYKMNPPLRESSDVKAIIDGIIDGTVDCIATDHAPHSFDEKQSGLETAPNGIIGLETALGLSMTYLVHKNHISISKLIELMSVNPRTVINVNQVKFEVGEKANLTVFAPDEEWIVNKQLFKSKSLNTPFDGFVLKGKPKYVMNNYKFFECNL